MTATVTLGAIGLHLVGINLNVDIINVKINIVSQLIAQNNVSISISFVLILDCDIKIQNYFFRYRGCTSIAWYVGLGVSVRLRSGYVCQVNILLDKINA